MQLVRRMALLCAALMLATIMLSAFMRLSQAGLGCAEWPQCYAQAQREAASEAPRVAQGGHGVAAARVAHRIVASVVLILAITMTLATLATRPAIRREGSLSAALLVLAGALAVLGILTPSARLPAVVLGNLLGGFVMLALCWRAARPPGAQRLPWVRAALALLLCQIALGALVSGSYAALSCDGWSDCVNAARSSGWDAQALNPWHLPALDSSVRVNPAGAFALLTHRAFAVLVSTVLVAVGVAMWRRGHKRTAAALLALTLLQVTLGPLAVLLGLPIVIVLLHNLVAALLLALLAAAA